MSERPTADPMPEPTPDRAVTELSNEELLNALVYQATEHGSNVNDAFFKGSVHRSTLAAITAYRVELLRRLTATERPAETVTMDRDTAVWAHRAASEMRRAVGEIESQLIWGKVEQNIKAALSAASDGGDCG